MTNDITDFVGMDVIDSREVIERIEELKAERDAFVTEKVNEDDDPPGALVSYWEGRWADENPDEAAELKDLEEFADECEGYAPDWSYGETIIAATYFEDYAQQLAEDIGAIKSDAGWPLNHIDWEAAADALKVDYTEVTLRGVDFWIR